MDLTKKTTILLSPRLYEMLKGLSKVKKRSIGDLIRTACEMQYGLTRADEALSAIDALAELELPVDTTDAMKRESVAGSKVPRS